MKRKLIQLAKKTLVVSIPTEIVEKFELNKKQEVDLTENNGNIIIRPYIKQEVKKITLDVTHMNKKLIKDLLFFSNTLGYDEITLKYPENTDLSFIEDLTNQIEGLAVMNQTKDSATFKHISTEYSAKFQEILERAFEVTLSFSENILEMIRKENYKNLQNLIPLEYSNNKLTSYCSRILLKGDYNDPSKIPFLFLINWDLEIIADFYRRICSDLSVSTKTSLHPKTVKCLEQTNKLFLMYHKLFVKLDTAGIIESFELKSELGNLVGQVFDEYKGIDICISHYCIDIATFIQDSISLLLAVNHLEEDS